ncbi:MAG: c-type cytochrome domain-containing protein [Caldilineaceae bacterium]
MAAAKQQSGRTGLGCSIALAIGLIALLAGADWRLRLLTFLNNPAEAAPVTVAAGPSANQLAARRSQEQSQLESYGWVDKANNTAHIPIARAIELVAAQGLPVGAPATSAAQSAGSAEATNPPADLSNVSYDDLQPIFQQHCSECHGDDDPEEGLQVTTYKGIMAGSIYGAVIKPNDPEGSYLVEMVSTGQMPKKGPKLTAQEIELIIAWINAGAPEHSSGVSASASVTSTTSITDSVAVSNTAPTATETVDLSDVNYQDNILPLVQEHCAKCHGADDPEEGLQLTTYKTLMAGSIYGAVVKPGDPDNSYLVEMVSTGQMPKKGAKLTPQEVEMIVAWIKAGAPEFGKHSAEAAPVDSGAAVTATESITPTASITATASITGTSPLTETAPVSATEPITTQP